jgi:hypothetical protein
VTPGGSRSTGRSLARPAAGTSPFRLARRSAWVTVIVRRTAEDVRATLPRPVTDLGGLAEVRVRAAGAGCAELGLRLRPAYPRDLWDRVARHQPERVLRAILRQAKAELETGGRRGD